ncbi:hypothetical protein B0T24DRAFT_622333 [Lasiosphaeria ovina]|uniref:Uncharacterized protein n=1 Tax=Lasiosphaeria ovina TaxID=92902 RepID=A0AAE0KBX0_9PEZI|nr:hypothetical protein B0T24DRAFT_622333 [Lasiosphaeria ovina]
MDGPLRRPRQAVHRFSLGPLVAVPILLAILTAATMFLYSDTNMYMLLSQCHARSRIRWLSRVPVIGVPLCFLTSFFVEALGAPRRSPGALGAVLSFVGALLTAATVEAARICNAPSVLIANPTGPWLVFNLVGGAVVWQLVILPAFLHRSREIIEARGRQGYRPAAAEPAGPEDPTFGEAHRHLARVAEVVAIPVAVAVGYVVPSVVMVVLGEPVSVFVWLFFPVYVSLVRQAVRKAVVVLLRDEWWRASFHLESSRLALASVYAVPIVCSVLSQGLLVWSLLQPDDRKEMTRSTIRFIVIDAFFIGLTVLYWVLVEAGWRVALVMAGTSVVLGPGAGVCIGWICRERAVDLDRTVTVVAVGAQRGSRSGSPSEETPLLR